VKSKRRVKFGQAVLLSTAFVVSICAVSNLMPLLLYTAAKGLTPANGMLVMGYFVAGTISIMILARAIYRVDKRAGRIHNRVGWFE
jgi:hypothetical protein